MMLAYYFELALRSFRRSRGLTALMLITIAMGVSACMVTLTVFHVLSGDPIPERSARLFYVQLDAEPMPGYKPGEEPMEQLARFDAEALLRAARGNRQAMMSAGSVAVIPERAGFAPFSVSSRYTSADFFPMFNVPFQYGSGWSAADDAAGARGVVIAAELNQRLYGGADSRGKTLRLGDKAYQIVGVLAPWDPQPHFFDLTNGEFEGSEQVFVPFSTAMADKLGTMGSTLCWQRSPGSSHDLNAPCAWIQYWVQLDNESQVAAYRAHLNAYSDSQRAAGRFERPANVRLRNVMDWLSFKQVVPSDVRLQLWLAFGFLVVCLVNTVGLLLAKCLRRSAEIGVRRALGAPRRAIFAQFLVEAGSLGLAGGVLGLGLTFVGLWLVRAGSSSYGRLVQLDGPMLAITLGLALLASALAGLLPAWRACQITPALQLKSQ